MKSAVKAWLCKAEADAISARREFRARKRPNFDSACFHAQQCVEKTIKAILESANCPIRKVHDLVVLLTQCPTGAARTELLRDDLELLSQYAVTFRYPGADATREQAKLAISAMDRCREQLLPLLSSSRGARGKKK
ncbi:MAG TPA: HEPN domain-containing protein [Kiritimatiellia bacterium]|jgi:HEPN domain-containing protein|nr:MAG: HEPN domain protein [Verrucomicrobia bacterium ADurb.Bin018]HOE01256.1 HEPN domain-containing protein [Kiritimatiellia bacterium]HOE36608.1 HEPN domain-containing protein [Kiritimatiellia bacterium]HOR74052.1 HEPN domain-containing protein [Kiritimatiellia bacterium]HOU58876.1 HEPN domain-containing protein [Kiritimatiellia bacterium]